MPQELPGFYYDAEKNRYFPIKSPIPGAPPSTSASQKPTSISKKAKYGGNEIADKVVTMLHVRELCGNSISSNKKKVNFENQYQKIRASKPIVWKYQETERDSDAALEHVYVNVQTRDGLTESEVLLTGGLNNMFRGADADPIKLLDPAVGWSDPATARLSILVINKEWAAVTLPIISKKTKGCYEVGSVMERDGIIGWEIVPDLLQPTNIEKQTASLKSPGPVYSPHLFQMGSNISCIKIPRNYDPQATDVDSSVSHALMTTLGSETSGGSVCLMNLSEPLDLGRRIDEISVFKSTIWTADSYSDGSRAVVGTNIGAALVNIETGRKSWICRSKSDVLSLQLDYSGKLVLCGLRNGAIVTVDTRQKPQDLHAGCPKHEISFPSIKTGKSNSARGQKRDKQWFEVRGNVDHSRMIFMPSSISCLVALKLYDQYFLASSMDGTMRLYDHRLTQRGAVQLYEGNVNSHTRIQMGVDPSERFLMSGGEDFYMRMWSIKSGEMLYEDKFMNSVPSVLCWARGGPDCNRGPKNHLPGAWLGSQEGLFYVNTS